jgi:hypothetical protein
MMSECGIFSVIDCYLRLAGQNEKISAFRADQYSWRIWASRTAFERRS